MNLWSMRNFLIFFLFFLAATWSIRITQRPSCSSRWWCHSLPSRKMLKSFKTLFAAESLRKTTCKMQFAKQKWVHIPPHGGVEYGPLVVPHNAPPIPAYPIQPSVSTFAKSHPIKKSVPYQLWSVMKQGMIVFYDSTPDAVYTDGAVNSGGPLNGGNNSKNFLLVLQQTTTCLSSVG